MISNEDDVAYEVSATVYHLFLYLLFIEDTSPARVVVSVQRLMKPQLLHVSQNLMVLYEKKSFSGQFIQRRVALLIANRTSKEMNVEKEESIKLS